MFVKKSKYLHVYLGAAIQLHNEMIRIWLHLQQREVPNSLMVVADPVALRLQDNEWGK